MSTVKSKCLPILTTVILVISASVVSARVVRAWSYRELFDKSDLVVIASPMATRDTQEHIELPGFSGEPVIGVETRFTVSVVLKGAASQTNIVLHYYRPAGKNWLAPISIPGFVVFPMVKNPLAQPGYMLFLVREVDGYYAPAVGQADPGMAIRKLAGAGAATEKVTMEQLADVLKECETIKPGMTRADLLKVFVPEGGLSTAQWRTYFFRTCPYIKVDVGFTLSDRKPAAHQEEPTDIIAKISKPYLDWSISD